MCLDRMYKHKTDMATPSICNVSRYAVVMVIMQYMYSYPSWSGNLFFLVEFVWSFFLVKRLYFTEIELQESRNIIRDLKGRLRNECDSHRQTKLKLDQTDARLCENNDLVNKKQEEVFELKINTKRELSEKETEIRKTNRKISETEKELEKLGTELNKSKDVESRLAHMNSEAYDRIAIITATQKRLDVKTQLSFNQLRVKLSEKETEITNVNRTLSGTQTELEKLRTEWLKSIDAERQLVQMNVELNNSIARITEEHRRLDVETEISFNNLRVELSEKETEITTINRSLSETQEELEKLSTEFATTKDAESRLKQMNNRIHATQKRLDIEKQISFSNLRVELSEKKTEITNINRTLSETQNEAEILRIEWFKSKDKEGQLTKLISELHVRIARITATQKRLDIETEISLNKLRMELSEKETEIMNINGTLSETQNEAEILRNEWVKSKDAESQLAKMISELHVRIARITVTQKRLDAETAANLSATETKLGRTEAALTAKQRALDDAKAKLEREETDILCSICLDSDRDSALVPCGHTSTCYTCSLTLYRRSDPKCPVCRSSIEQILKIYS